MRFFMGGILLKKRGESDCQADKLNVYLTYPPCRVKGFLTILRNVPGIDNVRQQKPEINRLFYC